MNRNTKESRFSRAKQRQGNVQKNGCTCKVVFFGELEKSVLHVQSVFLLIRSIVVVFYRSRRFHLVFSITRFNFSLRIEETINIKKSFTFSPG